MSITFHCSHCGKKVNAPDSAGGKHGKCPYCQQNNYIPSKVSEDELIELAPIDDSEEIRQRQMERMLLAQEHDLIKESGKDATLFEPLEQKSDLKPEDLYHYVVNYCLAMSGGNLKKAEKNRDELCKYKHLGITAVADFISGKTIESVLDPIPPRVLQGFLAELQSDIKKTL